jgi:hypothetical protein
MIKFSTLFTFLTYVAIFHLHQHMVFISRSWFRMQELVWHTINFNSRQSTDKQVKETGVSTVSFTGIFLQILRSLQRSSWPIQPAVWCVSYQSLRHSWDTDPDYGLYRLPDLEIGLTVGCDRSTRDGCSSYAHDPTSGISRGRCKLDFYCGLFHLPDLDTYFRMQITGRTDLDCRLFRLPCRQTDFDYRFLCLKWAHGGCDRSTGDTYFS